MYTVHRDERLVLSIFFTNKFSPQFPDKKTFIPVCISATHFGGCGRMAVDMDIVPLELCLERSNLPLKSPDNVLLRCKALFA